MNEPAERVTAFSREICRPLRGLNCYRDFYSGACAPGSMLTRAPRAKPLALRAGTTAYRSRHSLIGNVQTLVDNGECFAQLVLGNAKRRISEEGIPAHKGVEPFLAKVLPECLHLR